MIIPEKYSNKSIAILGLGKTGRAALSSFNLAGAKPLIVWDDNSSRLSDLPCKAQICNYENMDWGEIELLLCSPGIDQNHPMTTAARLHGCNIKSDIEVLWETESQANFLGITGTNGKSTTTALIAHILTESSHRNEVGGNLGIPALSLSHLSKNETYVL